MGDAIEMDTFLKLEHHDRGFDGSIKYTTGSYAKFGYSKHHDTIFVDTIMAGEGTKGEGSKMMRKILNLAVHHNVAKIETATSRPGFFKKFGFSYTAGQTATNAEKYTTAQLTEHEQNVGEEKGGGFEMVKMPPFT